MAKVSGARVKKIFESRVKRCTHLQGSIIPFTRLGSDVLTHSLSLVSSLSQWSSKAASAASATSDEVEEAFLSLFGPMRKSVS